MPWHFDPASAVIGGGVVLLCTWSTLGVVARLLIWIGREIGRGLTSRPEPFKIPPWLSRLLARAKAAVGAL